MQYIIKYKGTLLANIINYFGLFPSSSPKRHNNT